MARLDGSGPRGDGPMSGRTRGYCAANVSEKPVYGRGMHQMGQVGRRRAEMNRGNGRCMRNRFNERCMGRYNIENAEYLLDPKQSLEQEKEILEDRLNNINGELENLNDK